jgi:hypothetical protein
MKYMENVQFDLKMRIPLKLSRMKPRVPTHKAVKYFSFRASQEDHASWCIRNIKKLDTKIYN